MDAIKSKLMVSLILAAGACAVAWAYLHHRETLLLKRGKMTAVIAARSYLPATTRLQARHLTRLEIPAEYVSQGSVSDPASIIGQLTLVPFSAGEPLTYNKLSPGGQALASSVPEGKRAFSIPVDRVSGVSGMVRAGDFVDLFFMGAEGKSGVSGQASLLLQNIQVLASGDLGAEHAGSPDSSGTLTLALSPEEAELALFALARGVLHLGLRANGDTRLVAPRPVGAGEFGRRIRDHAAHENGDRSDALPE